MSSAAKVELGALYINVSKAVPMRQLLAEMGHKQPNTPIQTDNTTACGVVNHNIQPQRTQSHGHAFPLALLSRLPRAFPILLGSGNQQPSRLLDQTPLRRSSHQEEARNLNFKIHTQRSLSIHSTNTSYYRQRPCQDYHGHHSSLIHTLHNRGTDRVC